jgi:two-component system, NtrC family, sensor kinase
VARRWRIRHKLTLGLVLVVGIMALLLAGTLKGLLSYRWTMKTINSRLQELKAAQDLQSAVNDLSALVEGESAQRLNCQEVLARVKTVQDGLTAYRHQLAETLVRGRDEDNGFHEGKLVEALDELLNEITTQVREYASTQAITSGSSIASEPFVKNILNLKEPALNLRETIHLDMSRRSVHAREDYHFSIVLVSCTSVAGVLLLFTLAGVSYRWIVNPIRELHEKVGILAQGNFESRIEVQSGDEMQDLAEAFNDMTGRLHAIYSDLARQVNERSRQLVRSEKLAGIGFLAAGVAHEINNPLASIAFCGEALERRLFHKDEGGRMNDESKRSPGPSHPSSFSLQPSDEETVRNYLKMIQDEAFRCKNITQKLLEFSRVGERQKQTTDLEELIQSVIDMVQHHQSYKEKHIVFDVRQHPRALVNAEEIKSVVLNLVVNALDSMEATGKLTITLDTREHMAVMTFADTGCGMTPDVLENIFEPFFTRSRTGKGVGLGLSISHRIITQHEGEIEAASAGPNRGSAFTVRLPLTGAANPDILPLAKAA